MFWTAHADTASESVFWYPLLSTPHLIPFTSGNDHEFSHFNISGTLPFLLHLMLHLYTVTVYFFRLQQISLLHDFCLPFNMVFLHVGLRMPSKKAMAPHSSTLAWKIPWTEEPGRLRSMGSLRVGHDSATSLSLFAFMHWRKWQPTPVFLPGESQGWGSLVGWHLWGRTESDTTEVT